MVEIMLVLGRLRMAAAQQSSLPGHPMLALFSLCPYFSGCFQYSMPSVSAAAERLVCGFLVSAKLRRCVVGADKDPRRHSHLLLLGCILIKYLIVVNQEHTNIYMRPEAAFIFLLAVVSTIAERRQTGLTPNSHLTLFLEPQPPAGSPFGVRSPPTSKFLVTKIP